MLKKIIAIMLSLALLPALTIVSFAAVSTNEVTGTVIYADDFNEFTENESRNDGTTGYPKDSTESSVFSYSSSFSKSYGASTIKVNEGPDGTSAIAFGGRGSDINPVTINIDTSGTNKYNFSCDIKFSAAAAIKLGKAGWFSDDREPASFLLTADGKVQTTTDGTTYTDACTYQADTWYKLLILREGTSKKSWLLDADGNIIATSVISMAHSRSTANIAPCYMGSGAARTTYITLDNVMLTAYEPSENAPSCIKSSVEDGSTGIQRNVEIILDFDQEISGTAALLEADGTPVENTVTTEKLLFNRIKVKITGLLERKTPYKLVLSDVTNGELTSSDEISFTTEDLHPWNDIVVTSAVPNSTETAITFTIGEKYGYRLFDGAVFATVYDGRKMIACDMVDLTNVTVGELTRSFSLGTIPSGAKIRIILMDVAEEPVTLAIGTFEN